MRDPRAGSAEIWRTNINMVLINSINRISSINSISSSISGHESNH